MNLKFCLGAYFFSTFSVPTFDPRCLDYIFAAFTFTLSPVFVALVYIQLMNC
jgi:hypothetical protein